MRAITNDSNMGGMTPTGTKSITTNGTHDVTKYAEANVQVPASAVVSGTKNISSNGTHDVTDYAEANVQVSSSGTGTVSVNPTSWVTIKINGKVVYSNGVTGGATASFTF